MPILPTDDTHYTFRISAKTIVGDRVLQCSADTQCWDNCVRYGVLRAGAQLLRSGRSGLKLRDTTGSIGGDFCISVSASKVVSDDHGYTYIIKEKETNTAWVTASCKNRQLVKAWNEVRAPRQRVVTWGVPEQQ